jgi:lipoprotein-anchoring transpeptidase ErfK/SrfK
VKNGTHVIKVEHLPAVKLMRKYILCLFVVLLIHFYIFPASAVDVFNQYEKVIWIDQIEQVGAAYERGKKLLEFPIITGDDETPTPPGIYMVRVKDADYYSRKYNTPMSFSLFFDYKGRRAIHEGEVPEPDVKKDLATHGCIHVEQPYIEWLYDWAEQGKTVVVIHGWREGD